VSRERGLSEDYLPRINKLAALVNESVEIERMKREREKIVCRCSGIFLLTISINLLLPSLILISSPTHSPHLTFRHLVSRYCYCFNAAHSFSRSSEKLILATQGSAADMEWSNGGDGSRLLRLFERSAHSMIHTHTHNHKNILG
jgi:hypothetical protein